MVLVISSPSGAGKTSLVRGLIEGSGERFFVSISVTTRPKRLGEINGQDYYFISDEEYQNLIKEDQLIEHATVFGYGYGTPSRAVLDKIEGGEDVLFDIDWQGYRQIKDKLGECVVGIFLLPPSMAELRDRLMKRNRDSVDIIEKRMSMARSEISHAEEYDWVLVNDDLDRAIKDVEAIIRTEHIKRTPLNTNVGIYSLVKES